MQITRKFQAAVGTTPWLMAGHNFFQPRSVINTHIYRVIRLAAYAARPAVWMTDWRQYRPPLAAPAQPALRRPASTDSYTTRHLPSIVRRAVSVKAGYAAI